MEGDKRYPGAEHVEQIINKLSTDMISWLQRCKAKLEILFKRPRVEHEEHSENNEVFPPTRAKAGTTTKSHMSRQGCDARRGSCVVALN